MEQEQSYVVWVDPAGKLASFHAIDAEARHFERHESFLDYLAFLTAQGYRFQ